MKFSILNVIKIKTDNKGETHFIHPPRPAPRKTTSSPCSSTILVPEILRKDMGCNKDLLTHVMHMVM